MTVDTVGSLSKPRAVLTYAGYRVGGACLSLLPRPLSRWTAGAAALVAWVAGGRRRRVVADNLAPVLGLAPDSPEVGRLVRRCFVEYGRYWSDAARLKTSYARRHQGRYRVDNVELFNQLDAAGSGVIFVLAHIGSWEAGAAWTAVHGRRLTSVAEVLQPRWLFDWFVEIRKRVDLTVLPVGAGSVTELLAALKQGVWVALVADRDVVGDGVVVEMFGKHTRVPGGPALLALRSGAPLVPCVCYRQPRGRYRLQFREPILVERQGRLRNDIERVSQQIVAEFEKTIRAAPAQWQAFQPLWIEEAPTAAVQ